jgi:hypothetical protein
VRIEEKAIQKNGAEAEDDYELRKRLKSLTVLQTIQNNPGTLLTFLSRN